MIRFPRLTLFLSIAFVSLVGGSLFAQDPSVGATKRGNPKFFKKHAEFLERSASPAGVVFIGDSITEGWTRNQYNAANFGIGGDRTQHVIWRIEEGELDKVDPIVVVLMIGTNNTMDDSAKDIAKANRKIVRMIHDKLPKTKILLLAVFPRGPRTMRGNVEDPWEMRMKKIDAINADMAKLDNGDSIRFLDLGPKFMSADGTIAKAIMPDQLHLSPAGYQIWVEGMAPLLAEMMQ
jgi:lysophospholipase L1-like esterase